MHAFFHTKKVSRFLFSNCSAMVNEISQTRSEYHNLRLLVMDGCLHFDIRSNIDLKQ